MLVVVHVAVTLVAFGAIGLAGVYASTARHLERPGAREEVQRYFAARSVGEWALAAVPVPALAAVAVDPAGPGLGRAWVVIALALWVVALGAALGVARPARAALRAALRNGAGGEAAGGEAAGGEGRAAAGRLAAAAAVCDVVFVLATLDMVLKP